MFKNVVITGAAGGIGRRLVSEAHAMGLRVFALDLNGDELQTLEQQAKQYNHFLKGYATSVSNFAALSQACDDILKTEGSIDIWINNAGISGLGDFQSAPLDRIEQVIAINLMGTIYGTRLALQAMAEKGRGVIVNVDSVAGHIAAPYLAAYSASKHGVLGFSRALREELKLKQENIRIVSVSPGFVDTGMLEKGSKYGFPDWLQWTLTKPDDVAKDVFRAILKSKDEEVHPTLNGKILLGMNRVIPQMTRKSSRLLLAKNVRDLLFMRKQPPP